MKTLPEFLKENLNNPNFLEELSGKTSFNTCNLVNINEVNAKSMIERHSKDGYIVISPCRGYADFITTGELRPEERYTQRGRDELNRLNGIRVRSMIQQIKKSGYSYTPVYGGFIEDVGSDHETMVFERSFVIYNRLKNREIGNFDELYNLCLGWCKEYNQNSMLVQFPEDKGGKLQYIAKDGKIQMEFKGNPNFNDVSAEYFTELHKLHSEDLTSSKPVRVTFESVYVNPEPISFSERVIRISENEIFLTR